MQITRALSKKSLHIKKFSAKKSAECDFGASVFLKKTWDPFTEPMVLINYLSNS